MATPIDRARIQAADAHQRIQAADGQTLIDQIERSAPRTHEVLGLVTSMRGYYTETQVRRVYLAITKHVHPDRRDDKEQAEEAMKKLTEAYHAIAPRPPQAFEEGGGGSSAAASSYVPRPPRRASETGGGGAGATSSSSASSSSPSSSSQTGGSSSSASGSAGPQAAPAAGDGTEGAPFEFDLDDDGVQGAPIYLSDDAPEPSGAGAAPPTEADLLPDGEWQSPPEELVGKRIRVWWANERPPKWFDGTVTSYDDDPEYPGEHVVAYDDGETHYEDLTDIEWRTLVGPKESPTEVPHAAAAASEAAARAAAAAASEAPAAAASEAAARAAAAAPSELASVVRSALGLHPTEARAAISAMVAQHGTAGVTARMVRAHFEARGGYEPDALKPHKPLIKQLIESVVGARSKDAKKEDGRAAKPKPAAAPAPEPPRRSTGAGGPKPSHELTGWCLKRVGRGGSGTKAWQMGVEGWKAGKKHWSSAIVERVGAREVRTASGSTYVLSGGINTTACAANGLPPPLVGAFADGFPHNWDFLLQQYHGNAQSAAPSTAAAAPSAAAAAPPPAAAMALADVADRAGGAPDGSSVAELKRYAGAHGLDVDGVVDKAELVAIVESHQEAARGGTRGGGERRKRPAPSTAAPTNPAPRKKPSSSQSASTTAAPPSRAGAPAAVAAGAAAASTPAVEAHDWLAPTRSAMRVEFKYWCDDVWYRGVLAPIPAEGGEVTLLYLDYVGKVQVINLDDEDPDDLRARLRAPGSGALAWDDALAKRKAKRKGWTLGNP